MPQRHWSMINTGDPYFSSVKFQLLLSMNFTLQLHGKHTQLQYLFLYFKYISCGLFTIVWGKNSFKKINNRFNYSFQKVLTSEKTPKHVRMSQPHTNYTSYCFLTKKWHEYISFQQRTKKIKSMNFFLILGGKMKQAKEQ